MITWVGGGGRTAHVDPAAACGHGRSAAVRVWGWKVTAHAWSGHVVGYQHQVAPPLPLCAPHQGP